jgi:hypothetical protein
MFDPNFTRVECARLSNETEHGKFKHQVSRWDSQGGFVAGAEYQYNKMIDENNRLRMLVADVLYGFVPEDAGPEFNWVEWAELAIKEVGPIQKEECGVAEKCSI